MKEQSLGRNEGLRYGQCKRQRRVSYGSFGNVQKSGRLAGGWMGELQPHFLLHPKQGISFHVVINETSVPLNAQQSACLLAFNVIVICNTPLVAYE